MESLLIEKMKIGYLKEFSAFSEIKTLNIEI